MNEVVSNAQETVEQVFRPAADVFEKPEGYLLRVELPGVSKERLEVTAEDGDLTIRGHQDQAVLEGYRLVSGEYVTGIYERRFRLPDDVDVERLAARLRDGVLQLELPRRESARPRKIQVTTE